MYLTSVLDVSHLCPGCIPHVLWMHNAGTLNGVVRSNRAPQSARLPHGREARFRHFTIRLPRVSHRGIILWYVVAAS